ncbi:MAG: hypothetical protein E7426_03405 [Ruminococcaceae bacterium]|nr:hypothetical protein [Oscillospiraceae bacterium]
MRSIRRYTAGPTRPLSEVSATQTAEISGDDTNYSASYMEISNGLTVGRIDTVSDAGKQQILDYMWSRYRTEIHMATSMRRTVYSIICHDIARYPTLRWNGMSVKHGFVHFDLTIDGEHFTDCFFRAEDAYTALRVLYNLFEDLPLDEELS